MVKTENMWESNQKAWTNSGLWRYTLRKFNLATAKWPIYIFYLPKYLQKSMVSHSFSISIQNYLRATRIYPHFLWEHKSNGCKPDIIYELVPNAGEQIWKLDLTPDPSIDNTDPSIDEPCTIYLYLIHSTAWLYNWEVSVLWVAILFHRPGKLVAEYTCQQISIPKTVILKLHAPRSMPSISHSTGVF